MKLDDFIHSQPIFDIPYSFLMKYWQILIRPKAALFCAHWEIQNLVFMFFFPVFPLALFLGKQRSLDIHAEQNAIFAQQFVISIGKSLNLCLWSPLFVVNGSLLFEGFTEAFTGVQIFHHSNLILKGTWSNKAVIWLTSLWKPFRFIKISQYYPVGTTSFNKISLMNLKFNKAYVL